MAKITAELTSGTAVRIGNGRHTWSADEPENAGGDGTAPDPYEMLLGALAACTCITVALYCRSKDWKLDNVSVEYFHDRVHADDCDDCDDDLTGHLDRIRSRVFIDGDFDDEQRDRLREVAVRCPVHKTLDRGVEFTDEQVHVA